ncbi:MAG: sulfite exporter TauE/SafE family protein [Frankiaceae bacterium]
MTPGAAAAILAAGAGAGTINAIVGSGSLITFPTLVALGYNPLVANVSNNIGLFPGSVSGAVGYRRELTGQRRRLIVFSIVCAIGAALGAELLLALPPSVFKRVVPVLILLAMVLVLVQPWLSRRTVDRHGAGGRLGPVVILGMFLASIYGGYFGAAQGVIYIALLGIFLADHLQRVNALKNAVSAVVNGVAAVVFIVQAHPDWAVVALIAVGSTIGGQLGAHIGRRLPPVVLRAVIVAVGAIAIWRLL